MSHTHELVKFKSERANQLLKDSSNVVVTNVSGRTLTIGSPVVSIYPGESAVGCQDNPSIISGLASRSLKIDSSAPQVEELAAKPKKQKEEPKVEETFATVAEPEAESSVQLVSSDDGELSSSDTL